MAGYMKRCGYENADEQYELMFNIADYEAENEMAIEDGIKKMEIADLEALYLRLSNFYTENHNGDDNTVETFSHYNFVLQEIWEKMKELKESL